MRSPSKGKVVGSIPAGAFLIFCICSLVFLFIWDLVAQWKRVCLLSRRLRVRPPPRSLYADFYPILIFTTHTTHTIRTLLPAHNLSPHFCLSLPYPVSKGGRVVQGGSLRYCSLRRRGFEPHPLHFDFIFLHAV